MGREAVGCLWSTLGGSGKPPEQTVTYTHRGTLCGSLESAGLLQWLVFATVPKELPSHLPVPRVSRTVEEFLLNDVCWFLFSSVSMFTRLLAAAETPPDNVKFSTIRVPLKSKDCCLCSRKKGSRMGKSPFYQFLSSLPL